MSPPLVSLERGITRARLARWLGPWAPETTRPKAERRRVEVDGRFEAWVYRPLCRAPHGAILVVPGLHYSGPADPRLDRFLSVLAHAGHLVFAPFLPDCRALRVAPQVVEDAEAAWDALLALEDLPRGAHPGVLSISFGSYPALHLAARRDVGGLLLFGGYCDFVDAIRFSLGDTERSYDPLNRPVIFMNLLDELGLPDGHGTILHAAWESYVRETWGRPELLDGSWRPIAAEMSARLPGAVRPMFDLGTGLAEGGVPVAIEALSRGDFSHLDVDGVAATVSCDTWIVHGRDDDVIPYTHAEMLSARMPRAELLLTGLYAHTGSGMVAPSQAVAELRAMASILDAVASCGSRTR